MIEAEGFYLGFVGDINDAANAGVAPADFLRIFFVSVGCIDNYEIGFTDEVNQAVDFELNVMRRIFEINFIVGDVAERPVIVFDAIAQAFAG